MHETKRQHCLHPSSFRTFFSYAHLFVSTHSFLEMRDRAIFAFSSRCCVSFVSSLSVGRVAEQRATTSFIKALMQKAALFFQFKNEILYLYLFMAGRRRNFKLRQTNRFCSKKHNNVVSVTVFIVSRRMCISPRRRTRRRAPKT